VILGGDDEMGIRDSSAEALIRHETDFLLKNTSISREQNQGMPLLSGNCNPGEQMTR
jgi:hypothetical protein